MASDFKKSRIEVKVLRTYEDGRVEDLTEEAAQLSGVLGNAFPVSFTYHKIFHSLIEKLQFIIFKEEGLSFYNG